MGLNNSVHWLAWFLTTFTQMSITMASLTVLLKFGRVLMYSNALIVFLVLEVFAVATIAFSYVALRWRIETCAVTQLLYAFTFISTFTRPTQPFVPLGSVNE